MEAPVVVCCRCSPTQKATVVQLIQNYTQKICAAIGDGGNDVSMILAAQGMIHMCIFNNNHLTSV